MNEFHKRHQALHAAALTGALALTLAGCKSNTPTTAAVDGQDPAAANLAQPYTGGDAGGYTTGQSSSQARVMGQSESYTPQSSGQSYESQSPAPIIRQAPAGTATTQYYPVPQAQNAQYSDGSQVNTQTGGYGPNYSYNDAEEAGEQALAETSQAPPPLPDYDQPPAPEDNYLWTPGYWNYANTGYYWVPGVWCAPPFLGALWTPPYWGYDSNHYRFHRGYWGSHIGYYGGINYGFGYIGTGYYGGYWRDRNFYYNRAVTNVNIERVHNVYERTVIYENHTYGPRPDNRISYNGGRGGLNYQPRPEEISAMREAHYAPVPAQRENRIAAAGVRSQYFATNGGHPTQAFAVRPLGNVTAIPTSPREQAFNHPGAPNQPAFNNRPGEFIRPGTPNQPAYNNNRPGELNRPGTPNQPAYNNNHPGEFNRPGAPGQPANNGAAPGQPGLNGTRPGVPPNNQPGVVRPNNGYERGNQPSTNYRLPPAASQPNPAVNRAQPTPTQPNPGFNRSQPTPTQPATPAQPNPGYNRNQPNSGFDRNQPGANPRFNHVQPPNNQPATPRSDAGPRPTQPQPESRPNFQPQPQPRQPQPQSQPQPMSRPNFEAQRPAPQFQQQHQAPAQAPAARPAGPPPAPAARPSAPAPAPAAAAPHGGGGGPDRPHNR